MKVMAEFMAGKPDCSVLVGLPTELPGSARDGVLRALAELGELADRNVRWGQLRYFGDHLGWPDWLMQATSFEGRSPEDLPGSLAIRDDILITANIVDAGFASELAAVLDGENRLPGSPSTALALMTEPTLGTTLQRFSRKLVADNPYLRSDLAVRDGLIRFRVGYRADLGRVKVFISSLALIMLKQIIKAIAPTALPELVLEVLPKGSAPLEEPDEDAAKAYEAGSALLTLSARWFDFRNPVYDPALNPLIEAAFEQSVRTDTGKHITSERIRSRIAELLDQGKGPPRLKQIALELGTPTRTIVRRLRGEGTSFHEIVDSERRRRAGIAIADPQVSLRKAAESLGFPDASSFGRAFRRWYGVSPGSYRASLK